MAFDNLYDRMQERLDELRCVLATMEAATDSGEWHDLPAAVNVLRRTYTALDNLHDEFASWRLKEARS
jgi:hypothetical protein